MNLSDIPYKGTAEELHEVEGEILRNQRQRAVLDAEFVVLQDHRLQIRHLIEIERPSP